MKKPWTETAVPLAILVVVFSYFAIEVPNYLSVINLQQLLRDYAEPAMVALAMAVVIFAGGIDLSVGATFAIANFAALYFFRIQELPLGAAIVCTLLVGAMIGLGNGLLVAYGRARPFIATLAVLLVLRAGYDLVIHNYTLQLANAMHTTEQWDYLGAGTLWGIPANIVILIMIVVLLHLFLTRFRPGIQLMATGADREAASHAGIPVRARLCLAFLLSGLISAAAGLLYAARQSSAGSDTGQGMELTALAAIVLGGISLAGGRGSVFRVLIGSSILFVLLSGLLRMNMPGSMTSAISGLVLLVSVVLLIQWEFMRQRRTVNDVPDYLSHEASLSISDSQAGSIRQGTNDPLLILKNISKQYAGNNALIEVDFDVFPGEVHALVGENGAGKSTLGKIIAGAVLPSSGKILLGQQTQEFRTPADSIRAGIAMVYQETSLVPSMTVARNLRLGKEPLFESQRSTRQWAKKALSNLNYVLDTNKPVEQLSTAQRQLVELSRAMVMNASVIIFDEPTASLSPAEAAIFFRLVRALKARGTAIIFVTHALEEALQQADRITVLRDGRVVDTSPAVEHNRSTLIRLMVGRDVSSTYYEQTSQKDLQPGSGQLLLAVENLKMGNRVQGMTFKVFAGEIVGMAGLVGAGRTEAARIIAGDLRRDGLNGGRILHKGRPVNYKSPRQAVADGVIYVTEDRKTDGFFGLMTVDDNLYLSYLATRKGWQFWYSDTERKQIADKWIGRLCINTLDRRLPVSAYSGGNQQKVVIAKALVQNPELILFDEPARGVDVGVIPLIHETIKQLANQGKAVLVISSYLPEVMNLSDRILVASNGTINEEFASGEVTEDEIMHAAVAESLN